MSRTIYLSAGFNSDRFHNKKAEEAVLRIHFHGISSLAGCLLGFIIGVALTSIILLARIQLLNNTHTQNYGNALASMAANQSIDATFNHDLIRLQVILQDVIENPNTLLATIHDVENNLLVQAGDSRALERTPHTFTAPIILQDSIAGYVSVTLISGPVISPLYSALALALLLVLFAILVWELVRYGSFEIRREKPLQLETEETLAEDELSSKQQDLPKVYAIIHVKNLEVLKQQLNGENYRKTLKEVEETISDVLALYNGASYELENDLFRLTFFADDATSEALFRATCSAWLIVELASITNNIPLDLAAFVSANHLDLAPANLPIAGLVVESHTASDELIRRRLQLVDVGALDGRKIVSGFEQPFQSLLEKQRSQLANL